MIEQVVMKFAIAVDLATFLPGFPQKTDCRSSSQARLLKGIRSQE